MWERGHQNIRWRMHHPFREGHTSNNPNILIIADNRKLRQMLGIIFLTISSLFTFCWPYFANDFACYSVASESTLRPFSRSSFGTAFCLLKSLHPSSFSLQFPPQTSTLPSHSFLASGTASKPTGYVWINLDDFKTPKQMNCSRYLSVSTHSSVTLWLPISPLLPLAGDIEQRKCELDDILVFMTGAGGFLKVI